MLSYDKQLSLKRDVVVRAYQHFSGKPAHVSSMEMTLMEVSELPETSVPPILSTIPSPLQYGYRTKITPHFEAPPKIFQKAAQASEESPASKPDWLNIGFNQIGTRHVMDIEVRALHPSDVDSYSKFCCTGMSDCHSCAKRDTSPDARGHYQVRNLASSLTLVELTMAQKHP